KEGWGTFGGSITFISYGTFTRTSEEGTNLGTFESFDLAVTGSYGTRLSRRLAGGVSAKFLYSKLADQGAGAEEGSGNSIGFAVDFGLLYEWTPRLNLGLAITNIGPDMSYIDAAQSDPLPRNFALGFAYKLLQTDYYHLLLTLEANKLFADLSQSFGNELESVVLNGGGEFQYADLIAFRAGYIYDQAGEVKTLTLGAGLSYSIFRFDFSYIPSSESTALANTLRVSLAVTP
ncbi:PorV/PorQ family protein, partial [candidate division GN15 bacterium]|nr:PorV/PorQ family protein [candidate division GN15 bacterium]